MNVVTQCIRRALLSLKTFTDDVSQKSIQPYTSSLISAMYVGVLNFKSGDK